MKRSAEWFEGILARVEVLGYGFRFRVRTDGSRLCLQVEYGEHRGRKWWLSPWMTLSEVVRTAFMALAAYQEHELRESFLFDGARVFGPHISVEALRAVSMHEDRRREENQWKT